MSSPNQLDESEPPITTESFLGYKSPQLPPMAPGATDYFLADVRNGPFVDHQTDRLPPRQKWAWITVAIVLVVAAAIASAFIPTILNYRLLQQSGTSVSGSVVGHNISISHGKNGTTTTYSITYQFVAPAANGEPSTHTATQSVYYNTYYRYPLNSAIGILYLAGNPSVAFIASDSEIYDSGLLLTIGCGAIAIGCLWGLYAMWRRSVNWERLAREGVLVTGVVHSASGRWISGKGAHFQVEIAYSFTDPQTQQRYDKKASLTRNDLQYKGMPVNNSPVHVLYLDENHFQLL